ncbi:MAG: hypothetical protein BGO12_23040 [Verrucomicrobia bacterium 61-8]|nr:MAG: hypothetical protein BGO12_23040 [Verrucomicrobia bacterium 61-8]
MREGETVEEGIPFRLGSIQTFHNGNHSTLSVMSFEKMTLREILLMWKQRMEENPLRFMKGLERATQLPGP